MYKAIEFLGIKVSAITKEEMVEKILEFALTGRQKMITYLNAHCVNVSFTDFEYREILKAADLVYAGGKGVVWASRLLSSGLSERVNILDFFDKLAKRLKDEKVNIYLLGAQQDVVEKASEELKSRGLIITGFHNGFFHKTEERNIINEINALKPNILIVGLGIPKQEKWIYRHLNELDVNLCWGVGAVFNNLSGKLKRAPQWMIDYGLEWLYRLYQEPKRLWKRYLFGNLLFIYRILKWRIKYGQYK